MGDAKTRQNKPMLVTGTGSGIGRAAIALEFARARARAALRSCCGPEGAASAVEETGRNSGKVAALKADLNQVAEARELAEQAVDFVGGHGVLANNGGITINLPFEQATREQFDTLFHVNVRAISQPADAPSLQAPARRRPHHSSFSIHSFKGFPQHPVSAGTTGAIIAYRRKLAIKLTPRASASTASLPLGRSGKLLQSLQHCSR